ncbi:MAG: aspartate aminotransferase family protein [Gammaproteobacteria bacterium]|nr:aspartate aminotransferase family protein [Gammaproteobacteria bacterium]
MTATLMSTYNRQAVAFDRGEGAWLWDAAGKKYLDAMTGVAVCGLGHAHPTITRALCDQAQRLWHTSNHFRITQQETLGERLAAISGMDNVFMCNSGAEANEAAIKLARLYGHNKGIEEPKIIVTEGSFHGRTLATLSATGNRKIQAGFEPLVRGFVRVPYNDLEAVQNVAKNTQNVVAILVEPVQGEGGINIPSSDYLPGLRRLCDENGWLLMLDEIQTCMGRTGQMFAFQHHAFTPDVMTLAKGLGNGFPIGACLAHGVASGVFQAGKHGTTFGGNPLACRVANTVIDILQQEKLVHRAGVLGLRILDGLRENLGAMAAVKDVRGYGLMLAVELDRPCTELVAKGLQQGLVINVTAERVVRLLPPLILSDAEADLIVQGVSQLVREFLQA